MDKEGLNNGTDSWSGADAAKPGIDYRQRAEKPGDDARNRYGDGVADSLKDEAFGKFPPAQSDAWTLGKREGSDAPGSGVDKQTSAPEESGMFANDAAWQDGRSLPPKDVIQPQWHISRPVHDGERGSGADWTGIRSASREEQPVPKSRRWLGRVVAVAVAACFIAMILRNLDALRQEESGVWWRFLVPAVPCVMVLAGRPRWLVTVGSAMIGVLACSIVTALLVGVLKNGNDLGTFVAIAFGAAAGLWAGRMCMRAAKEPPQKRKL